MANVIRRRRAAHAARRPLPGKALPVIAIAAALTLSGCAVPGLPGPTGAPSEQPVQQAAAVTPVPDTPPTPTPAPVPVRVPVPNDLASGSASRHLGAAGNQLIVDYWTNENTSSWTSASSPIIQISAKVAGDVDGKAVKITRFNARVDALNTVLANDTGDFAIGTPQSYSSAILVPAHPGADSTRIVLTFDLLTETAPGTGVFTRQTVMDSLTLGYSANSPATDPAQTPQK
jgi:hypothetical protein